MEKNPIHLFAILLIVSSFSILTAEKGISNFKLKNATNNKWVATSDYKNAKGFVVVFLSNKHT